MGSTQKGQLILIGGREDKKGECEILRAVVQAVGGRDGVLALLAVASRRPEPIIRDYVRAFSSLGLERIEVLTIDSRQEAFSEQWLQTLRRANGVFITGGDQLRLTAVIGGTSLDDLLHQRYAEGLVIAGSSAGASAMTENMIVGGAGDDSPEWSNVRMAPGLGFLKGAVVDQHFAQRGRIGRLLGAVAQNPHVLGMGLDEDTALIVEAGRACRVLGARTVSIVDGRTSTHSNASEIDTPAPLALWNVTLHVLPAGYVFDLNDRFPGRPEDAETPGGEK